MSGSPDDVGDPGELLQALRPYEAGQYLAPGDDPKADALLQHLVAIDLNGHRARSRGRRIAVLAIGISLVGAGATAALVISRSAGNRTEVSCYSSADVAGAHQVVIPFDSRRTPVDQCAELWTDGRISSGGAPALVACVTPADIVAVVPGDESTCSSRGWAVAASVSGPIEDPAAAMPGKLSNEFAGQCLDPTAAANVVEAAFVELKLTDWSVRDTTTKPGWCAVPVVDVDNRIVNLVSHPR